MKKYEELHYTIQGLDSHEVRYFKLFATRHVIGDANKYMQLFDAIREQTESDDEALRKRFKGTNLGKNLPAAKQYLLKLLHKSLYHYHDNDSPASLIKRFLRLTEIYLEKLQFELCTMNLTRAYKIAVEQNLHAELIKVFELRTRIFTQINDLSRIEAYLKVDFEREQKLIYDYQQITQSRHALIHVKYLSTKFGKVENATLGRRYQHILNSPFFSTAVKLETAEATLNRMNALSIASFQLGNQKMYLKHTKELLLYLQMHREVLQQNRRKYLVGLNNYLGACILAGKFKEYDKYLRIFRGFKVENEGERIYVYERFVSLELFKAIKSKKYREVLPLLTEIEKGLLNYKHQMSTYMIVSILYQVSICLLNLGDYKRALHWNKQLVLDDDLKEIVDMYEESVVLNWIIHFELGNTDLLASLVKSYEKELLKSPNELWALFLENVKVLIKSDNAKKSDVYGSFYKQLKRYQKEQHTKVFLNDFDVLVWLERKMK